MTPLFDDILETIKEALKQAGWLGELPNGKPLVINRDMKGQVTFLLPKGIKKALKKKVLDFADGLDLGKHAPEKGERVLDLGDFPDLPKAPYFHLEGFSRVIVYDRLLQGMEWGQVEEAPEKITRLAFYSVKGGVGRSTAVAVTAWHLARQGKNVLVLDLDLESPGVSANLLSEERMPKHGLVDWLVEELVENGDAVKNDLTGISDLSKELDGEIRVVPAYGKQPGEYISKLGRVFLPKVDSKGNLQNWSQRLENLLKFLEEKFKPDYLLLDARAGLDDTAAVIVTNMKAFVLLFALDARQTWSDYRVLFNFWLQWEQTRKIRNQVQMVAGLVPETDTENYLDQFRENAWNLFLEKMYDEVSPDASPSEDAFSFDRDEEKAPHNPWIILWNRGFQALPHLESLQATQIEKAFGSYLLGLDELLST